MFEDFENLVKGKINSFQKKSTPTDMSRVPQTFTIKGKTIKQIKLLSQGSFGFIWLAQDINTKQKFALKRIVCINNERFQLAKNELQLMIKFPKSNNIVGCYGGELVTLKNGNTQNKLFVILMEYCPNGTLFDMLQKREKKGFSQNQIVVIARSILEGLKNIHQTGVYHQDVKIENILIGQDKKFKLCDFGSCSNRFIDMKKVSKTEYNNIKQQIEAVTTPMYRPPQIVDPYLQYEIGYKVDVWMVGCVIYTLAFFTHPFVDSNAVGIAGGVYRFPKYPQETQYQVSDKIKDLVRNLLTPNPVYRPSVNDAITILNNWNTMSSIPLNKQAQRRKQEQKQKEKELDILNKKVVDFDGDIPMDKLLEIQQRLKNNSARQESQFKSFSNKPVSKHSPNAHLFINVSANSKQTSYQNNIAQFNKKVDIPKQKQQTIPSNSFWGTTSSNKKVYDSFKTETNKAVSFDNFFNVSTTKNSQKSKSQANQDMYDFFFPEKQSKKDMQIPPKKGDQHNLLDL